MVKIEIKTCVDENIMLELSLSIYVTAGLGALVLIIGAILVKQSPMLKRMCIPAAVVGGILFSIICTALYYTDTATIELDGVVKDLMMMVFFCSIGFMASIRMIRSGGRMVLI